MLAGGRVNALELLLACMVNRLKWPARSGLHAKQSFNDLVTAGKGWHATLTIPQPSRISRMRATKTNLQQHHDTETPCRAYKAES